MPRPRSNDGAKITGWVVGAAYMPPVAIARILRCNGQPARDAYMRPLQTCRKFVFSPLYLTFRLFVGRGLDPSLPLCGYCLIPRRGEVTPPYIALHKNVPARRAHQIYYFLFIISYLNNIPLPRCPAPFPGKMFHVEHLPGIFSVCPFFMPAQCAIIGLYIYFCVF